MWVTWMLAYIIRYIEEQTAAQEKQASNGNATKVQPIEINNLLKTKRKALHLFTLKDGAPG